MTTVEGPWRKAVRYPVIQARQRLKPSPKRCGLCLDAALNFAQILAQIFAQIFALVKIAQT